MLVGALAVNAWGYLRATKDVDIVPNPDPANIERLMASLAEIGGRVQVDDLLTDPDSVGIFLRAGDRALVITELGMLDVLQGLPLIPRFEELDESAGDADLAGITVRVCSIEHLVAMKRAADRPMDRIDLEALKTAHPEAFENE